MSPSRNRATGTSTNNLLLLRFIIYGSLIAFLALMYERVQNRGGSMTAKVMRVLPVTEFSQAVNQSIIQQLSTVKCKLLERCWSLLMVIQLLINMNPAHQTGRQTTIHHLYYYITSQLHTPITNTINSTNKRSYSVVSDQTIKLRCPTEPCQLPIRTQKRSSSTLTNAIFQAKSLSLINRIDHIDKKKIKTKIMKEEKNEWSQFDPKQTPEKKNSHLLQKLLEVSKENKRKEQDLSEGENCSESKVVRLFQNNYHFRDKQITNESLKIDFNKNDLHLFSRSRRKVLAVEALALQHKKKEGGRKAIEEEERRTTMENERSPHLKENNSKHKLSTFTKIYYQRYMKTYMGRKNMLREKEWLKKIASN